MNFRDAKVLHRPPTHKGHLHGLWRQMARHTISTHRKMMNMMQSAPKFPHFHLFPVELIFSAVPMWKFSGFYLSLLIDFPKIIGKLDKTIA